MELVLSSCFLSTNYDIWHGYANQFFGKVTVDASQARWNFGNPSTYKLDWTFGRQNTTVTTTTASTPIPTKSVFPPGHIINVQEVKK